MSDLIDQSTNEEVQRQTTAKHFLTDLGVLGAIQLLYRFRGLIILPIIAKGFGAVAYGVWTQFFLTVQVASSIITFQLNQALVRYVSDISSPEDKREYFYSLLFIVVIFGSLLLVPMLLFSDRLVGFILGDASYANLLVWMGAMIVVEAVNTMIGAMFRALLQIKRFAILEATKNFARLILVIIVLVSQQALLPAVQVSLLVQLAWLILMFGLLVATIGFSVPDFRHLRKSLSFSLPLIPSFYSLTILRFSDRFIINIFLGPAAVGFYAASYNLVQSVTLFYQPFFYSFFPTISRLWDNDRRDEVKVYMAYGMKYLIFIAAPGIVGVIAFGPALLGMLTNETFASSAGLVMPLVVLGIVLGSIGSLFSMVLRLYEKTLFLALAVVVAAFIHLGINFLLIPEIGIVGGAVATFVGFAVQMGLLWWMAWRFDRYPLPARFTLITILASLPMIPIANWITLDNAQSLIVAGVISLIIYLMLVIALGGVSRSEVQFFWSSIRGRRRRPVQAPGA